MKRTITAGRAGVASLMALLAVLGAGMTSSAVAAETAAMDAKTKRVPALREKVYSQLARAQKMADEGQVAEGLAALDNIKRKAASMNAYEVAMLHNFYGFIHYNQNDLARAIASFELVVAQEAIPGSLRLSTLFSLAQLAMAQGDYPGVIRFLERWEAVNTQPKKDSYYVLKSQALYQDKQYQASLNNISEAIALYESDGKAPKENWLVLQRALHYSLKQPKQVTRVLEKMVRLYNKPAYWVQLGGMYGETGEEQKQLAIMEAAHQQGFLTSGGELRNLAQIYLYNGLAYKAAHTMQQGLDQEIIEATAKNFAFVAEALVQAREMAAALPYFDNAAKLTEHGKYDQRMAEIYLNTERYDQAATAAWRAIDKGGLERPATAYVALGMAQYNRDDYDAAIVAFEKAGSLKGSSKLAGQWLSFVRREKQQAEMVSIATR